MDGAGRNLRYILGLGLVIVLLFVVIFMIVHSGNNNQASKVPETKKTLTSYASDSNVTVSETIVGPIVDAEHHDEIQINVTNSGSNINFIKGYDGNVVNSRSYPLSQEGFSEFLSALDKAGFTKGDTDKDLQNDKGFCPTGQRYIFEMHQGAQSIQRFWATSCHTTKTYKGNLSLTIDLFESQIPDYDDLNNDADFSFGLSGL